MQSITLPDALQQIRGAIKHTLQDAMQTPGELSAIASLVIGRRARPRPDTPALWVFSLPARNEHTSHGLAENWEMPVVVAAYVQHDDPEEAEALAGHYATTARKLLVADRRLGLNFVKDVTSDRFQPEGEHQVDNQLVHSSWATVLVKFNVFER